MPLTNIQYDAVMRGYQERQLSRQRTVAARKKELYEAVPRIAQLDGEIASLSVEKARLLLDGDTQALSDLRRQVAAISEEKKRLMRASGYPEDYLEPPYACPDCRDTGYIGSRRCHCLKQAAIDLVYTQSNLRDVLEKENFETFSLRYYGEDIIDPGTHISSLDAAKNALAKCRQFVRDFDSRFENILLFGDTGVGKTFLSHCVAKELLDTGHSVIYFSAHRLFEILAQHTFEKNDSHPENYQNIFDCDLLIIDDLGTEMANYFTVSQFFVCLNERILNRRSTLISSNLELYDITSIYSERISSRLTDSFLLLHLFGSDIRVKKKLGGC